MIDFSKLNITRYFLQFVFFFIILITNYSAQSEINNNQVKKNITKETSNAKSKRKSSNTRKAAIGLTSLTAAGALYQIPSSNVEDSNVEEEKLKPSTSSGLNSSKTAFKNNPKDTPPVTIKKESYSPNSPIFIPTTTMTKSAEQLTPYNDIKRIDHTLQKSQNLSRKNEEGNLYNTAQPVRKFQVSDGKRSISADARSDNSNNTADAISEKSNNTADFQKKNRSSSQISSSSRIKKASYNPLLQQAMKKALQDNHK